MAAVPVARLRLHAAPTNTDACPPLRCHLPFLVVWGMLLDLALGDRPSLLGLLGAALVCSASLVVVLAERRGGPGGDQPRPAVKAKGSDAHEWQRLAGEEEDGAGSQPPAQGGRQLELAEAGSARIGAVRWGSAADVGQGFDAQIKAAPLLPESLKE